VPLLARPAVAPGTWGVAIDRGKVDSPAALLGKSLIRRGGPAVPPGRENSPIRKNRISRIFQGKLLDCPIFPGLQSLKRCACI